MEGEFVDDGGICDARRLDQTTENNAMAEAISQKEV